MNGFTHYPSPVCYVLQNTQHPHLQNIFGLSKRILSNSIISLRVSTVSCTQFMRQRALQDSTERYIPREFETGIERSATALHRFTTHTTYSAFPSLPHYNALPSLPYCITLLHCIALPPLSHYTTLHSIPLYTITAPIALHRIFFLSVLYHFAMPHRPSHTASPYLSFRTTSHYHQSDTAAHLRYFRLSPLEASIFL